MKNVLVALGLVVVGCGHNVPRGSRALDDSADGLKAKLECVGDGILYATADAAIPKDLVAGQLDGRRIPLSKITYLSEVESLSYLTTDATDIYAVDIAANGANGEAFLHEFYEGDYYQHVILDLSDIFSIENGKASVRLTDLAGEYIFAEDGATNSHSVVCNIR
jgi:hypothetical protein